MSLKELDLKGYGHFLENGSFEVTTPDLPDSWEYYYQNRDVLLKVDQFGPAHAQAEPPGGNMLFRRDAFEKSSCWLTWVVDHDNPQNTFSNFFRPNLAASLRVKPDLFRVVFSPEKVTYIVEFNGLRSSTEFILPVNGVTVMMRVTVTNIGSDQRSVSLLPVLRPYLNPASLAPWDRPEWYLKSGFCNDGGIGFWTQLLNMDSKPENRQNWGLWSTASGVTNAEISYEKFVGCGNWLEPGSVVEGDLRMAVSDGASWGTCCENNTIYGYPPVYALQYKNTLQPGEAKTVQQVLSLLPHGTNHTLTSDEDAKKMQHYITENAWEEIEAAVSEKWETLKNSRMIKTEDACFDQYVNEWLPLQQEWVCSLDRGWPSGMRGSRDSANDFITMVAINPDWCVEILKNLFSCQQTNGWFPRQYSAFGRKGKHDMRGHVDAGTCVIELLYEYLCHTKNFGILQEVLPWLDSDNEATIWEHIQQIATYYLDENNIGEHGLCKIREGDWLDSVNRAGLEGRGESVTVSCQVVMSLTFMIEIMETVNLLHDDVLLSNYQKAKQQLTENIREHAFNESGYFNSVFTDNGEWIFSDNDPDGEQRLYGPVNWFAIFSGVAGDERTESILNHLDQLKSEMGYLLFQPPMGKKPINNVGRGGTGDQPAGLWENGNVYNHGSQGFLARALAAAGQGNKMLEVLRYMMPYDQVCHPVEKAMTPPYAIVNCWQQVPGFRHRGGLQCLTGSIAVALRAVYDWMLGFRPALKGVVLDPCLPDEFETMTGCLHYCGKSITIDIEVTNEESLLTVNGDVVHNTITEPLSKRVVFHIPDSLLVHDNIEIRLKIQKR